MTPETSGASGVCLWSRIILHAGKLEIHILLASVLSDQGEKYLRIEIVKDMFLEISISISTNNY